MISNLKGFVRCKFWHRGLDAQRCSAFIGVDRHGWPPVEASLAAEQASFPRSDPPAISSVNANTAITVDAVRILFFRNVTNVI